MDSFEIDDLSKLISSSKAVYADLRGINSLTLRSVLVLDGEHNGADFTDTEADEFISRYEIAAPMASSASGFQSILFHDKIDNKYVLAIRGSEQFLQDFVWADGGNIGDYGYAASQSLDLYRYWKQLQTPLGQRVNYSYDELKTIYGLSSGGPASISTNAQIALFDQFQAVLNQDVGLLSNPISSGIKVDVVGHSLGGNL